MYLKNTPESLKSMKKKRFESFIDISHSKQKKSCIAQYFKIRKLKRGLSLHKK